MKLSIYWFRRDLRLEDNTALIQALKSNDPVQPIFIFDSNILDELAADDARVSFIYERLEAIHESLRKSGSSLMVLKGNPLTIWKELISTHEIASVYINKDYEPYALERDRTIESLLQNRGIPLLQYKDQVIFEKDEVLKKDGKPYTVYTPYKRRWHELFDQQAKGQDIAANFASLCQIHIPFPSLESLGFRPSSIRVRPYDLSKVGQYDTLRDIPYQDATSYLSPHLRFGTISIRQVIAALEGSHETFLNELIWREFFMQILYHFPSVVDQNFRPKYNGIQWRNNEQEFESWCEGRTGFPLVDAGMRQLNSTGFMHNRVRMVTASFLCKHLLIDWRWGEAYFASKLLDYELSSNNGNWQWAAGTGCDAAPYFRVFNPHTQQKRFDPKLEYVKEWVPEYGSSDYVGEIVEHSMARNRALQVYKQGIQMGI